MGPAGSRPVKQLRYEADDVRAHAEAAYQRLHRELRTGPCYNVDTIHTTHCEARSLGGVLVPVALLEVTSVRETALLRDREYLEQIITRLRGGGPNNDSGWLGVLRRLAAPLALTAGVVILDYNCTAFCLYLVDGPVGRFLYQTRAEHADWLRGLRAPKVAA